MLLFQLSFSLYVLLLELCYEIISQLHLISWVKIFCLSWGSLKRVRVSFFLKDNNLFVEFFDLLLLTKQFILFFLDQFFLAKDLFDYFFIICFWPFELFFIHISISFQFFNKAFIFSLTFLLIIQLTFQLSQSFTNSIS